MEQPSTPSLRPSGIPRLSKLPVFKGPEKTLSNHDPIKCTPKTRSALAKGSVGMISAPAFREADDAATAQVSLTDIKPTNELTYGSQHEAQVPGAIATKLHTLPRRPRPSLSDRTIETLSQVPPSPSPQRRKSSFFPPDSPSRPSSRPGSSLNRSRPSTSQGHHPPLPSGPSSRPTSPFKRHLAPTTGNQNLPNTPSRRSISSYHPKIAVPPPTGPNGKGQPTLSKAVPSILSTVSPTKGSGDASQSKSSLRPMRGSKTLSARPSKARPSAQDVFARPPAKPSGTTTKEATNKQRAGSPPFPVDPSKSTAPLVSPRKKPPRAQPDSGNLSSPSQVSDMPKKLNSSAALRETIARAKAARQKDSKMHSKGSKGSNHQTEVFPDFNIGDTPSLLRNRVASARIDGRLNIAALGLKKIPPEVMNMYNANLGNAAWYESVDLVRLIAADNEFEYLEDAAFPDRTLVSHEEEDDYQGNLFGALETLDLHGNHLRALPIGLRRLERLTSLNLSKNKLDNDCISIISQIHALQELRLADNAITGMLAAELCALKSLEVLDLHSNLISALPNNLSELCNLRTINIAGNRMVSLPFECFSALRELDAARNRLSGTLLPPDAQEIATLKVLDVSSNALTSIAHSASIRLPSLQSLNVAENRLKSLPDVSEWTQLFNLTAAGNQLFSFPEGLTSLSQVKAVDLSRNDIKHIDERIAFMDSLTMLRVANNPLRERRFLNMETEEIKRELKARLLPEETTDVDYCLPGDAVGSMPRNEVVSSSRIWPVKPGGILNRSSTLLETLEPPDLEPSIANNDVKALILNRNRLQVIPQTVDLLSHSLTILEISHNKLSGANYLTSTLSLPNLTSLDLSVNAISTLSPVSDNLSAPKLAELNISRNRLVSLLPLRTKFHSLVSLLAADNGISVLEADVARGLQVLDVSGNELDRLDPKLGLLGAEGLRTLIVGGNRFRVPRRDVIDKGTEAVLTWLRSRIPEGQI